jgi:dihydroorotate dehydrogenase
VRPTHKELICKLQTLTRIGNHGEAYQLVAEYFDLPATAKIFSGINLIHTANGYLPQQINDYRHDTIQHTMEYIRVNHAAQYWSIYDSLMEVTQ